MPTFTDVETNVIQNALARSFRRPPVDRDSQRVMEEYNIDKYGRFLEGNPVSFRELLQLEATMTHRDPNVMEWIWLGSRLSKGPAGLNDGLQTSLVLDTLHHHKPTHRYHELGCGFGRFLHAGQKVMPNVQFSGGDFSQNAVTLAQRFGLDVNLFNFNDIASYAAIKPDSTVFTVQAVEQLQSAMSVVEGLYSVRHNIRRVIHFEPGPYPARSGAFGHLCNAYTAWHGYNQDLVDVLHSHPAVRIVDERFDVLGINILNPIHVIVWEFRQ